MITPASKLIEDIESFSDSDFLADRLDAIADDMDAIDIESGERYYLKECAQHIRGMYGLVRSLAFHVNRPHAERVLAYQPSEE